MPTMAAQLWNGILERCELPTGKRSAIGSGCFSRWLIVQDQYSFLRGFCFEQRKIEPPLQIAEERHSTAQNDGVELEPVVIDQVCLCQGRNQLPTAEDQEVQALLLLELGNGLCRIVFHKRGILPLSPRHL